MPVPDGSGAAGKTLSDTVATTMTTMERRARAGHAARRLRWGAVLALAALLPGCASLGQVIQPLGFRVDSQQQAQLRLTGPSAGSPLGGAALRVYVRVSNPNPVGLTLSRITGGLLLEGTQAARVDFPLGLPLQAGQETVIPLDIGISFADLPGLAGVAQRALSGTPIRYQLDGTFSLDAGLLGQPTFGPTTLFQGEVRPIR